MQCGGAGRLACAVPARQRHDLPAAGDVLVRGRTGEHAAEGPDAPPQGYESQRQGRAPGLRPQAPMQGMLDQRPPPGGEAGTQRLETRFEAGAVDPGEVPVQEVAQAIPVALSLELRELGLDVSEPPREPRHERVPQREPRHRAEHQQDELQLGCRRLEHAVLDRGVEEGLLDGEDVRRHPRPAHYEAVVDVEVEQLARVRVKAEEVQLVGNVPAVPGVCQLEVQLV